MISMTGYGMSTFDIASSTSIFEFTIQSVNRKNLDFQIFVPQEWSDLEPKIVEWSKDLMHRGRILIHLKINKRRTSTTGFNLNSELLIQSIKELDAFCKDQSIPLEINASTLIKLNQIVKEQENLPDWKDFQSTIQKAFNVALSEWQKMRTDEGTALMEDLRARLKELFKNIELIGNIASDATTDYAQKLLERLKAQNLDLDLDDDRVLKEIAFFADRSDISEELIRLNSHLNQFSEFLESKKSIGRKMDFLCIEIFREFNTISSKTQQIEITKIVLDCKNELERIREQVQNIE